MNIKKAKDEIKNTIQAYLRKDVFGNYKIPSVRQRPILLMGPPGIGKTAIMEQIARECRIGFVSYTMTHHTRQSAVGLPMIEKKNYQGTEYTITEYTMSEILASVYEKIQKTGIKEGIIFLDEINCVSETLAPALLQFLQGKTFGNQKLPEGWIITAAGNPPEYNISVRDFDLVTLDRVRQMNVEADYEIWKAYAYQEGIHEAILAYLDVKRDHFYCIETTIDGKYFVTARGWQDLSDMLFAYEELELPVETELVRGYIRHPKIADDFANYYELYKKYQQDYQVEEILMGTTKEAMLVQAEKAPFDERLSLLSLLLGRLFEILQEVFDVDQKLFELFLALKELKNPALFQADTIVETIALLTTQKREELEKKKEAGLWDRQKEKCVLQMIATLEGYGVKLKKLRCTERGEGFSKISEFFSLEKDFEKQLVQKGESYLKNAFLFVEKVFSADTEMVVLLTELTMNYYSMWFIREFGCEKYFEYQKILLFQDKEQQIKKEMKEGGFLSPA